MSTDFFIFVACILVIGNVIYSVYKDTKQIRKQCSIDSLYYELSHINSSENNIAKDRIEYHIQEEYFNGIHLSEVAELLKNVYPEKIHMIRDISETKCSMCGAGISSEKWEGQHTNGHRNEYRSFDCGKKLRFSPNFMKVLVENDCERNPLHKEIMEKGRKVLVI